MTMRDVASNVPFDRSNPIRNDGDYDALASRMNETLENARRQYCRGVMTFEDVLSEAYVGYFEVCAFAAMCGGRLLIRNYFGQSMGGFERYAEYARIQDDWRLWQSGKAADSKVGEMWLRDANGDGNDEASAQAKRYFLRIFDALKIPIATFEHCPDDIPSPRLERGHQYFDCTQVMVVDTPTDDGGLLRDNAPVGKTFSLAFSNGSEINIRIAEADKDKNAYVGDGTISGYASLAVEREIYINSYKGELRYFGFDMRHRVDVGNGQTGSDFDVYNGHPLWERYRQWQRGRTHYEDYKQALLEYLGSGGG